MRASRLPAWSDPAGRGSHRYGGNTKAAIIRIGLKEMQTFITHFYPVVDEDGGLRGVLRRRGPHHDVLRWSQPEVRGSVRGYICSNSKFERIFSNF